MEGPLVVLLKTNLASVASSDDTPTPTCQISPDGVRTALYSQPDNVLFSIVVDLMFSPGGNECEVTGGKAMILEFRALVHYQCPFTRDCVEYGVCRGISQARSMLNKRVAYPVHCYV